MTARRRFSNRLARGFLGVVFSVMAFVIEWRVVKAIRQGQPGPKTTEPVMSATRTADGVEVTAEDLL